MSGFFNSLKNFASGAAYAASSASKYEELEGEQCHLQRCTTIILANMEYHDVPLSFIVSPCCMRISILTFAFWLLLRFSFFLFLRKLSSLFVSAPLFFCCFTSNSTGRRDSNSKRKWSNPSIQMDDFFLDESTMMISDRINRVVLDTRIFVAQRGYCYVCTRLIRCNFFDYLRWKYVKLYPRPTRLFPSS